MSKYYRNFMKTLILILLLVLVISSLTEAFRIRPKLLRGELQLSKSPKVDENATLTLSFDSMCNESFKAEIVFWIPDGITAQTQTRFERAYVHAKSTDNRYSVAISVDETGNYTFRASIYAKLQNGRTISQHFYTHLLVTPLDISETLEEQGTLNSMIYTAPQAMAEQIEVFGQITYFDLNEAKFLPISGLKMILVKDNLLKRDEELAISYTDANGKFSFPLVSKDLDERLDLYIVASFENDILYITDRNGSIYEFQSKTARDVQTEKLEFELELDKKPELGSIFNSVTKAYSFFMEKVRWSRDKLQIVWPARGNISYYYVESLGNKITTEKLNIIEEDAWEKISIYHEYGHSVMTAAYGNEIDALPQSDYNDSHMLSTVSDPEFAMNEGWAEFVEAAVEDNAFNVTGYINADRPNIETNAWWTGGIDGNGKNSAGENVEGAVASILWDINDTKNSVDHFPNADDDGISDMFTELWTVFVEDRPTNITDIAVGWRNRSFPKLSELEEIYAQHHALSKRNSPPVLTITEPSEDVVVNQSFKIRWNVKEPDGDDYKVNLFYFYQSTDRYSSISVKSSIVLSLSSDYSEYTWNTKSLKEGRYRIIVQAVDSHGKVAQETSDGALFIDHSPLMPPEITSSTHPDQSQWYADNSPRFKLDTIPETNPRRKYSYIIDKKPKDIPQGYVSTEHIPDKRYDHIGNLLEIPGLTDGEWYLHIRALDELGYWTEPSHFSVKIDGTSPPTVKNVRWKSKELTEVTLMWDSVSDLSGIEGYQVQIDVDSRDFTDGLFYDDIVKDTNKTFELASGSTYYARVKAKNGVGLLSRNWSISAVVELKASNPYDLNNDGRVDLFDLVLVGKSFGKQIQEPIAENPDVNGDGRVDIFDLVLVGKHFGETQELMASPLNSMNKSEFETRLYQNYPNPFNLETWIPYTLERDAEVNIQIYNLSGNLVKTLSCGYQRAGDYTSRSKAAFWNGKDEHGVEVASGVYFYVLQAGNSPLAIKKMLVVK